MTATLQTKRAHDWPEYKDWHDDDCWCGTLHETPYQDAGHQLITELRIPQLVESLNQELQRPR